MAKKRKAFWAVMIGHRVTSVHRLKRMAVMNAAGFQSHIAKVLIIEEFSKRQLAAKGAQA